METLLDRAQQRYKAIQAYYLEHKGKDWSAVAANPALFNRVWRRMLRLPQADIPPPMEYRKND